MIVSCIWPQPPWPQDNPRYFVPGDNKSVKGLWGGKWDVADAGRVRAAVHPSICCSASCSPPLSASVSQSHTPFLFYYLSPAFCLLVHLSLSPANESRWGFSVTADAFLSARYQGPNCLLLPYQRRKYKKREKEKKVTDLSVHFGGLIWDLSE